MRKFLDVPSRSRPNNEYQNQSSEQPDVTGGTTSGERLTFCSFLSFLCLQQCFPLIPARITWHRGAEGML